MLAWKFSKMLCPVFTEPARYLVSLRLNIQIPAAPFMKRLIEALYRQFDFSCTKKGNIRVYLAALAGHSLVLLFIKLSLDLLLFSRLRGFDILCRHVPSAHLPLHELVECTLWVGA